MTREQARQLSFRDLKKSVKEELLNTKIINEDTMRSIAINYDVAEGFVKELYEGKQI